MVKIGKKTKILLWIVGLLLFVIGGFSVFISYQMSLIPDMSFADMLLYTTNDNQEIRITVGIIKDGNVRYSVYGSNGQTLYEANHTYEIGSITKTITAGMISKAISEGLISLDDTLDMYFDMRDDSYYPSIGELMTHTSGLKGYYFKWQMAKNKLGSQGNSFYNIPVTDLDKDVSSIKIRGEAHGFKYSNFGYSLLGRILEKVHGRDYEILVMEYLEELGLNNTALNLDIKEDNSYWQWNRNDAYIPAGALLSNVVDMLEYLKINMESEKPYILTSHKALYTGHQTSTKHSKMDIFVDSVGMGWMIDEHNSIIWHNGATSNYNSYIGFDKESRVGVVILSNAGPSYRIPATVMGVKLINSLRDVNN